MDVVKILLSGLKHALKILSFVTEKIQKKKATELRCLCFLHEIVLFFFFFLTVLQSSRKNKACQFPQPEKGFSHKRPCPQLASPITPPGVKSGGLPSFLGVP